MSFITDPVRDRERIIRVKDPVFGIRDKARPSIFIPQRQPSQRAS